MFLGWGLGMCGLLLLLVVGCKVLMVGGDLGGALTVCGAVGGGVLMMMGVLVG